MVMNTVFYGRERQRRIRAFLLKFPYAPTSILQKVFFPTQKAGKRKARSVLADMAGEQELIKRFKHGEYVYYVGKKSTQWRHMHDVTMFHFDIFFRLKRSNDIIYKNDTFFSLKQPQEIVFMKREFEYPGGRADALYIIKLKEDGSGVKFFLEWDDGENEFDKIPKYEAYANSRVWTKEYWADPLKTGHYSFPQVLIVSYRDINIKSDVLTVKLCEPGDNYLEVLIGDKEVSTGRQNGYGRLK